MSWESVVSSNVSAFSFEESSNTLWIIFMDSHGGVGVRMYRYSDVPARVVDQLREAPSKGKFVCSDIAFKYAYELIPETDSD